MDYQKCQNMCNRIANHADFALNLDVNANPWGEGWNIKHFITYNDYSGTIAIRVLCRDMLDHSNDILVTPMALQVPNSIDDYHGFKTYVRESVRTLDTLVDHLIYCDWSERKKKFNEVLNCLRHDNWNNESYYC